MSKRKCGHTHLLKKNYRVYQWVEIYPDGYDGKCEMKKLEFSAPIKARSFHEAIEIVKFDEEIIGDDFIGYPDDNYLDSHPEIEIVWTDKVSAELV
jgi:hypothetical protein